MTPPSIIDENTIDTQKLAYLNGELSHFGHAVAPLPRGIKKQNIALVRGSLPWHVNEDVSDHEQLHYQDMPLEGIFDLYGTTYAYIYLGNPIADKPEDSIWLYGTLTANQANKIRTEGSSFESPKAMMDFIYDCLSYTSVTVAMWTDEGLAGGKDLILLPKGE